MNEVEADELAVFEAFLKRRRCDCYHEAGHAVIAHKLGFHVTSITVEAEHCDQEGREMAAGAQVSLRPSQVAFLSGYDSLTKRQRGRAADLAVVLLAGVLADTRYSGDDPQELWQYGGKRDRSLAVGIAYRMRWNEKPSYEDWLTEWEATATDLLNEPKTWLAVERVADRLFDCVDLVQGKELREMMIEAFAE